MSVPRHKQRHRHHVDAFQRAMEFVIPEPLTKVVHPTLNASTGLMDAARLAGMIPAMAADTASVAAAATITGKFTPLITQSPDLTQHTQNMATAAPITTR